MPETNGKPKNGKAPDSLAKTGGRHTKLTPELQQEAVGFLRQGQFVATVCSYLKISEQTWYQWMLKGEAGQAPYAEFRDAANQAQAAAEMHMVTVVAREAGGDPNHKDAKGNPAPIPPNPEFALRWVQRRYPKKFDVSYQEHAHSGEVTQRRELGITVSFADPERRAAIRTILDALTDAQIRQSEPGRLGDADGEGQLESG